MPAYRDKKGVPMAVTTPDQWRADLKQHKASQNNRKARLARYLLLIIDRGGAITDESGFLAREFRLNLQVDPESLPSNKTLSDDLTLLEQMGYISLRRAPTKTYEAKLIVDLGAQLLRELRRQASWVTPETSAEAVEQPGTTAEPEPVPEATTSSDLEVAMRMYYALQQGEALAPLVVEQDATIDELRQERDRLRSKCRELEAGLEAANGSRRSVGESLTIAMINNTILHEFALQAARRAGPDDVKRFHDLERTMKKVPSRNGA